MEEIMFEFEDDLKIAVYECVECGHQFEIEYVEDDGFWEDYEYEVKEELEVECPTCMKICKFEKWEDD